MAWAKKLIPIGNKEAPNQFEVKTVAIEHLAINPFNPNVMDEGIFKRLRENIRRFGYVEPILVAPIPKTEDYIVLDGAHRVLAMLEEGYKSIEVVITKMELEEYAKYIASYPFNITKGRVDTERATKLFLMGTEVYKLPEDFMRQWAGLDKSKWDEFLRLYKSGKIKVEGLKKEMQRIKEEPLKKQLILGEKPLQAVPVQQFGRFFLVSLAPNDFEFVKNLLRRYDTDDAKALVMLCKKHVELLRMENTST